MDLWSAMLARHTVRRYTEAPLPPHEKTTLIDQMERLNHTFHLSMTLVTDAPAPFGALSSAFTKGVKNYFVLSGPKSPALAEQIGYASASLMLLAQTLGLNTWWIGATFSRSMVKKASPLAPGDALIGIIAVGYGQTQGEPHISKPSDQIAHYDGVTPDWFSSGTDALLLAPTALNLQAFELYGREDEVLLRCRRGPFSAVDLGIGKYFFEAGAGKENFHWAKEDSLSIPSISQ